MANHGRCGEPRSWDFVRVSADERDVDRAGWRTTRTRSAMFAPRPPRLPGQSTGTFTKRPAPDRAHTCRTEWRGEDLNLRPSGYEPDELPDCSTPRRR